MGGHRTPLCGIIVDSGRFPWKAHARKVAGFLKDDLRVDWIKYRAFQIVHIILLLRNTSAGQPAHS